MRNALLTLVILPFALWSLAQGASITTPDNTNELHFEVNRVPPPLALSKLQLENASTIVDLNPYYKPSWVQEFISVEVSAHQEGQLKKEAGKDDSLTAAQKQLLKTADTGKAIAIKMHYIPNNTLVNNEPKWFDFKFLVEPEQEASYIGGKAVLLQYIQEKAIANIPKGSFEGYDLAVVRFTISEEGEVVDAHVFGREYRKAKDASTDALLLEVIRAMPCWKAAEYANGLKVKQDFALSVGNHESCVMNLIKLPQD